MESQYYKNFAQESYKEFIIFLSMCGKKDRDFFDAPADQRSLDDHVRLMYITLIFGFRKTFLRLLVNAKEEAAFFNCLCAYIKDLPTIIKRLDSFVNDIPIPEFKQVAMESWKEIKKEISEEGFDVANLIY